MAEIKIGEVARLADTPASTIRYYERIGLLLKPWRVSGQRVYRLEVLGTLEIIKNAQEFGFTLEEIKTLLNVFHSKQEPSQICQELARQKIAELENLIAKANTMKRVLDHGLSCSCNTIQGCYVASGE